MTTLRQYGKRINVTDPSFLVVGKRIGERGDYSTVCVDSVTAGADECDAVCL